VSRMTQYQWEEHYEAAVLETDRSKLAARIKAAQMAIDARLEEIQKDHHGTPEEREAIASALSGLRILKEEVP